MPLSATADRRRIGAFTRQDAIECLQEYGRLYGPDFTAAAFNPATARWQRHPEFIERYERGRPDGRPWMSLNAIKKLFPTEDSPRGSFDAARVAAGFSVNTTGPRRRKSADIPAEIPHVPARVVTRITDRSAKLSKEVARLREQLARSQERADRVTAELRSRRKVKPETRVIERTVPVAVADDKALAMLQEMLDECSAERDALASRVADLTDQTEALQAALGRAAQTDRVFAEQTALVAQLRVEQRETRETIKAEHDRALEAEKIVRELTGTAEQLRSMVDAAQLEREQTRERLLAAEDGTLASFRVAQAESRADAAEKRAQRAERQSIAHAEAATGKLRPLTQAELQELRRTGPSGPSVFARALKRLAKARSNPGGGALHNALDEIMRAAKSWQDVL